MKTINVYHQNLKPYKSDNIYYKYASHCPFCKTGILIINKDNKNILSTISSCTSCAQWIHYVDIEEGYIILHYKKGG